MPSYIQSTKTKKSGKQVHKDTFQSFISLFLSKNRLHFKQIIVKTTSHLLISGIQLKHNIITLFSPLTIRLHSWYLLLLPRLTFLKSSLIRNSLILHQIQSHELHQTILFSYCQWIGKFTDWSLLAHNKIITTYQLSSQHQHHLHDRFYQDHHQHQHQQNTINQQKNKTIQNTLVLHQRVRTRILSRWKCIKIYKKSHQN